MATGLSRCGPRTGNRKVLRSTFILVVLALLVAPLAGATQERDTPTVTVEVENPARPSIFGFRDAKAQRERETQFLAVPDARRAEQHLQALTAAPHMAGTPEDRQTAEYVARQFREAGFDTEIVEYKVWINCPLDISVEVVAPTGLKMRGPTPEHVTGDDPFQNDRRVVMAFNGFSPSGEVEAEVVYANYGRPDDLKKLKDMGIDVRGKVLLVRYGKNYRGVKSYVAQENGAAGVIIYSDPIDDGWFKGDKYPQGPWRPDSGVQRGSVGYMFEFPGDPTTPGIASLPGLPNAQRISPQQSAQMPKVPTTPLSYRDVWPILEHLGGPASPREWQGALPFTYHVGPGPVRVHMRLKQDYAFRSIWNVIGKVRGSTFPDEWVIAGNHRDAWVYGAVDPGSGTVAMLEAARGIGALLKSGWRPQRTLVFASWDAEEQGLIGSTEWAEQNAAQLAKAAAYFNTDAAVSGPNFGASAVPSLKQFVRDVTKVVPSPRGGTVYDAWLATAPPQRDAHVVPQEASRRLPAAQVTRDVPVGDLGSGSDYVAFFQHLGIPATDFGSWGAYGVYHSVFDNFAWFKKFADPTFAYEQQQARVLGIEMLRMADADVLPYDYEEYAREIQRYLEDAKKEADARFGANAPDFNYPIVAAERFNAVAVRMKLAQTNPNSDTVRLNAALRAAERAFLLPEGLPTRPWYKHAIYAPGRYTGYAAVVLPGVNEALDQNDLARTAEQLRTVTAALERATQVLQKVISND
ncbi:MAG: M28 family metallopeptidase [Terriglobales bacterium]